MRLDEPEPYGAQTEGVGKTWSGNLNDTILGPTPNYAVEKDCFFYLGLQLGLTEKSSILAFKHVDFILKAFIDLANKYILEGSMFLRAVLKHSGGGKRRALTFL